MICTTNLFLFSAMAWTSGCSGELRCVSYPSSNCQVYEVQDAEDGCDCDPFWIDINNVTLGRCGEAGEGWNATGNKLYLNKCIANVTYKRLCETGEEETIPCPDSCPKNQTSGKETPAEKPLIGWIITVLVLVPLGLWLCWV